MSIRIPELAAANPVIMGLLEYVLERRDRQILAGEEKPIALTLDPGNAPRDLRAVLAPFNDPLYDDGELWEELQWLANDYRCFSIKPAKRPGTGRGAWEGARLYFDDRREQLVREWLDRPRPVRVDPAWQRALTALAGRFECPQAFPPGGLQLDPGFESYDQLLECWAAVGEELAQDRQPTWRQLSARSFLGDSKYLDAEHRQALVRMLFPGRSDRVRERPILMHLYLPEEWREVLLVENQDSFLAIADCRPETMALVYIEGYRGGAARVRAPGVVRFGTLNEASLELRRDFLQWWQGQSSRDLPAHFWGDLDYEGMHIAAALKRSFASLDCWRPGYERLLARLQGGGGHPPELAGKARQRSLGQTGCPYADEYLIPALEREGACVDQEALSGRELHSLVAAGQ
ncbi:Wadjet anti-phage system protein JetD domain-containing protein [Microbulbifer yueqingensis]|uniref:Wadjet protein JetD C-terminal domain-containing protein n=1 Tax=Microbulbifer yueqingensis TaxID=658219 RepID=A0A1G9ABD8_9GAMM|nr:Wadjet anti-phage system protein JetD domain-containing protein [Microbulbifer yueqingensis]SDK24677.1 hypothetical protein SAMN05216212_1933 [Microbulbifer yueqingensis]